MIIDIKYFCRLPAEIAKNKLPIEFKSFKVEARDTKKYGHEETWSLTNKAKLKPLGLKTIQIEIHQGIVQMVWLIASETEKDITTKNHESLSRVGLKASELTKVWSEHRVKSHSGFPIRILGENQDYFECFEYHAGH